LDVGVGTVNVEEVGARRGAAVFVFDVGVETSVAGTNDGLEFSEVVFVIGVGDGVSIGADTVVGEDLVSFDPGVKTHESAHDFMTKHSQNNGKVIYSSSN
jgi:hypothetical protein